MGNDMQPYLRSAIIDKQEICKKIFLKALSPLRTGTCHIGPVSPALYTYRSLQWQVHISPVLPRSPYWVAAHSMFINGMKSIRAQTADDSQSWICLRNSSARGLPRWNTVLQRVCRRGIDLICRHLFNTEAGQKRQNDLPLFQIQLNVIF